MKALRTWGSLVVLILGIVAPVQASCMPIFDVNAKYALENADVVFSGEVITVARTTLIHSTQLLVGETVGDRVAERVTFQVLEAWKGVATPTVTVLEEPTEDGLLPLEQGDHYLVYAYYGGVCFQAGVVTSGCTRTRPLAAAHEDFEVLGPGSPPPVQTDTGTAAGSLLPGAGMSERVGGWLVLALMLVAGGMVLRRRGRQQPI